MTDLVGLLGSVEDAKLLAGGQSLMPMLNLRLAQPDHLIDLNTVEGLDGVEVTDQGLRIGAMARQVDLMADSDVVSRLPIMTEALHWVGHFQTRTRGTLGGSLAHLDPAAELPVVALLHDAVLTIHGPDGARQVAMTDWPLAYMVPNIGDDEVLTAVDFVQWSEPSAGYCFDEFARRYGDFAIVAVGALLAVNNDVITRAAVAVAGAQPTPSRLTAVEDALVGQPATSETFKAAGELARQIEAMSDSYTSGRYRQRLTAVLTERTLTKAAARAAAGALARGDLS